jgi:hypothetical protein
MFSFRLSFSKTTKTNTLYISLASKTVFLLTFSSLAIARMLIPSPRLCLITYVFLEFSFILTIKRQLSKDPKSEFIVNNCHWSPQQIWVFPTLCVPGIQEPSSRYIPNFIFCFVVVLLELHFRRFLTF